MRISCILFTCLTLSSRAAFPQMVRGQVIDSISGVPVNYAMIMLVDQDGVEVAGTIADPDGLFLLRPAHSGSYRLRVQRAGYRISNFPPFAFDTTQVAGFLLLLATVSTPPVSSSPLFVEQVCQSTAVRPGEGVLLGTVRDTGTRSPIPDARVVLTWHPRPRERAEAVSDSDHMAVITTDASGRYVACGVPGGTAISVHAADTTHMSDFMTLAFVDSGVVRNEAFHLTTQPLWREDFDMRPVAEHTARLFGAVSRADTETPLADAVVELFPTTNRATTDANGQFAFTGLPAGVFTVVAKKPGFYQRRRRVHVEVGETIRIPADSLRLDDAPLALTPIVVETTPAPSRRSLEDFWRRRKRGFGEFLTREEFERLGSPQTPTDVLRRMPGISIQRNANYGQPLSNVAPGKAGTDTRRWVVSSTRRGPRSFQYATFECPPLVFVDRVYLGDPWYVSVDDVLSLFDVEAIEMYNSVTSVPLELNRPGAECGAVVFWTR